MRLVIVGFICIATASISLAVVVHFTIPYKTPITRIAGRSSGSSSSITGSAFTAQLSPCVPYFLWDGPAKWMET